MRFHKLHLPGAYVIKVDPFRDFRGEFSRLFCAREFAHIGLRDPIAQINHSTTSEVGTIRGLHFQKPPKAEVKVVRCLKGIAYDVVVDLRKGSGTFLKWHGEMISPENLLMVYIPKGFAHGFQSLEPLTELLYLHTESYDPAFEGGLRYDDPAVGIKWPVPVTEISERDRKFAFLTPEFSGLDT
jgi:dTDP-4-dehydrorhamnose 3,5-epimerase